MSESKKIDEIKFFHGIKQIASLMSIKSTLEVISALGYGYNTAVKISRHLDITTTCVYRVLYKLLCEGYITKEPKQDSEWEIYALTPSGKKYFELARVMQNHYWTKIES